MSIAPPTPRAALQRLKKSLSTLRRGGPITIRPSDLFIVSYPKSGNTWMRFLAGNLLAGHQELDFAAVRRLIPDLYQRRTRELESLPSPRYIKSHEPWDPRVQRAVAVVRDPRSVATSYFFFLRRQGKLRRGEPFATYLPRFLRGELDGFGAWDRHVEGWYDAARGSLGKILLLRYEDLKQDPEHELKKVADLLGLQAGPPDLRRAVERSSFERMKRLDGQRAPDDPALRDKDLAIPFVRRGTTDEWKEHFTPALLDRLRQAFGRTMGKLGYH